MSSIINYVRNSPLVGGIAAAIGRVGGQLLPSQERLERIAKLASGCLTVVSLTAASSLLYQGETLTALMLGGIAGISLCIKELTNIGSEKNEIIDLQQRIIGLQTNRIRQLEQAPRTFVILSMNVRLPATQVTPQNPGIFV